MLSVVKLRVVAPILGRYCLIRLLNNRLKWADDASKFADGKESSIRPYRSK
jgi:hypothetical protein